MSNIVRKSLAVLLCTILAIVFSAMIPETQAHAATKDKLPKTITEYYWEDAGVKQIASKESYKYNKKGDPIKIVYKYYEEGSVSQKNVLTLKYTYKKGTKRKVVIKENGKKYAVMKFNKKGQLNYVNFIQGKYKHYAYKYDKKGYLVSYKFTGDGGGDVKFKTTLKKGKLKKIREITSGTAYVDIVNYYDKSGLIKSYVKDNNYTIKYSYKKKKGLVTRMTLTDEDGYVSWYDYTYSKTKVTKKKYNKVINLDPRTMVGNL